MEETSGLDTGSCSFAGPEALAASTVFCARLRTESSVVASLRTFQEHLWPQLSSELSTQMPTFVFSTWLSSRCLRLTQCVQPELIISLSLSDWLPDAQTGILGFL